MRIIFLIFITIFTIQSFSSSLKQDYQFYPNLKEFVQDAQVNHKKFASKTATPLLINDREAIDYFSGSGVQSQDSIPEFIQQAEESKKSLSQKNDVINEIQPLLTQQQRKRHILRNKSDVPMNQPWLATKSEANQEQVVFKPDPKKQYRIRSFYAFNEYYDIGCNSAYTLYGYWNFQDWSDYGDANKFTFYQRQDGTYDIRLGDKYSVYVSSQLLIGWYIKVKESEPGEDMGEDVNRWRLNCKSNNMCYISTGSYHMSVSTESVFQGWYLKGYQGSKDIFLIEDADQKVEEFHPKEDKFYRLRVPYYKQSTYFNLAYHDIGCYSGYTLYAYDNFPNWEDGYGEANKFKFYKREDGSYDIRLEDKYSVFVSNYFEYSGWYANVQESEPGIDWGENVNQWRITKHPYSGMKNTWVISTGRYSLALFWKTGYVYNRDEQMFGNYWIQGMYAPKGRYPFVIEEITE